MQFVKFLSKTPAEMMHRIILLTLLLTQFLFPQLKELEVKSVENRGGIPIFRDHPDKAGIIFYTQFDDLKFYSSYGIVEVKGDPAGGKYVVIIEAVKQTVEVRAPGFKTEMIRLESLQPRDVMYYEVLPKKDAGLAGVSEVGITLQVSPSDASILLDGKTFPNNQTTKISLGNHSVRIEKPGYTSYEKEISVTPDQTLFKIDLQKVQLSAVTIRSNPSNATVYINNENKGTTEVGFYLYSGIYDLRLEFPDHVTISEKLEVIPSSDKSKNVFNYNLVKDKGILQLSVEPANATLTINGNIVKSGSMELTPGKYQLEAKSSLYDNYREEIEISRGITTKKEIKLGKNTGVLVLDLKPTDATVLINKEKRVGNNFELVPGLYEVEVNAETHHPETFTVQVEKEKTVTKSVTLKQKVGTLQFTIKPLDAKVSLSQNGTEKFSWTGMNLLESIPEGVYDLKASSSGYKTFSKQIVISEGKNSIENIQMTPGSDAPEGMVFVEGGTFTMGSNDGQSDEKPVHQVTVSSFLIGRTEVTQALWESVMGKNPSNFKGSDRPVEQVSWYDVVEFCNKLSENEGLQKAYSGSGEKISCNFNSNGYRLPTEAEWEYAARGGNKSKGYKYSGSNDIAEVGWYAGNSGNQTKDVSGKRPNELGMYDMSGNVWEWCWDWYGNYSSGSQTDPRGPNSGSYRVLRGGSWAFDAVYCRVAFRDSNTPDDRYSVLGFRIVRTKN